MIPAAVAVGALALTVSPLSAHAFGQRYDLPIPLNYFLVGAVATVFLSFVLIGLFVQRHPEKFDYPRLNLLRVPGLGPVLSSPVVSAVVRTVSVLMFLLLLVAGFFGTDRAIENISPTFIWIIWWVGMGYIVALVGNVWVFINPWKITFEWYQRLRGHADEPEDPPFTYPQGLDIWPALLLFFLFAWAENVYTGAFRPFTLSVMVVMYSIVMWVGMAAFGKHVWLRNGEAFTVLFGFFSRFSPTELRVTSRDVCRDCASECQLEPECVDCYDCYECAAAEDRQLNLRPFAVGLALQERQLKAGHVKVATAAFVVLALATVSFDGFQDTETWANMRTEMLTFATSDVVDTVALALAPALFAIVYLGFVWANQDAVTRRSRLDRSGQRIRVLTRADSSRVQPRPLHNAPADPGAADNPAGVGPVRVRVEHIRHGGIQAQPEHHRGQGRVVHQPHRYRAGPRDLGVSGPRDLPATRIDLVRRAQGTDTHAGADDYLHRHQPMDNRPAHSGVRPEAVPDRWAEPYPSFRRKPESRGGGSLTQRPLTKRGQALEAGSQLSRAVVTIRL